MASTLKGNDKYYFEYFKKDGKSIGKATEIKMKKCNHKSARVIDGVLRCKCGAFWTGPRIKEVERLLRML